MSSACGASPPCSLAACIIAVTSSSAVPSGMLSITVRNAGLTELHAGLILILVNAIRNNAEYVAGRELYLECRSEVDLRHVAQRECGCRMPVVFTGHRVVVHDRALPARVKTHRMRACVQ